MRDPGSDADRHWAVPEADAGNQLWQMIATTGEPSRSTPSVRVSRPLLDAARAAFGRLFRQEVREFGHIHCATHAR